MKSLHGLFRKVVLIFLLLERVVLQSTLIKTLLESILLFFVLSVHHRSYHNPLNNQLCFFWMLVTISCLDGASIFSNEGIDSNAKKVFSFLHTIYSKSHSWALESRKKQVQRMLHHPVPRFMSCRRQQLRLTRTLQSTKEYSQ